MGHSRREFIRRSCCTAAALGVATNFSRFGLVHALAQNPTDFRALVCIFLFGGNDANNTLIQFDTAGYNNYSTIRGPLAIPQSQLLQLSSAPNFALNPNLPDIQVAQTQQAASSTLMMTKMAQNIYSAMSEGF